MHSFITPHMCREAYWIRSLLQIVSCECTTARVGGARPSTIEAWQSFLLNIRNYLKEWLLCSCCPSLSPSLLIEPWDVEYVSAVWFCFILDILLCCVWKKIKIVDNKKKKKKKNAVLEITSSDLKWSMGNLQIQLHCVFKIIHLSHI